MATKKKTVSSVSKVDIAALKKSMKAVKKDPEMKKAVLEARKFLANHQNALLAQAGKKPKIEVKAVGCAACIVCGGCVITPGVPDAEIAVVTGADLF